jgi:hypothetical protein
MDLVDGDQCNACGARFPESWKRPIRCNHRHAGRDWSQSTKVSVETTPISSHWIPLHQYPVQHWHSWDAQAATNWFSSWRSRIPNYGCACHKNFSDYCQSNPPDFSSAESFFQWTVEAHNFVSLNHVQPPKPTMTLVEARLLHGVPVST